MFPAGQIAWILGLVLSSIAIVEAGNLMRAILVAVLVILYVLPLLFPAWIPAIALLLSRVALGMFCYLDLKTSGFHFR